VKGIIAVEIPETTREIVIKKFPLCGYLSYMAPPKTLPKRYPRDLDVRTHVSADTLSPV
jgi:hypothetical protein